MSRNRGETQIFFLLLKKRISLVTNRTRRKEKERKHFLLSTTVIFLLILLPVSPTQTPRSSLLEPLQASRDAGVLGPRGHGASGAGERRLGVPGDARLPEGRQPRRRLRGAGLGRRRRRHLGGRRREGLHEIRARVERVRGALRVPGVQLRAGALQSEDRRLRAGQRRRLEPLGVGEGGLRALFSGKALGAVGAGLGDELEVVVVGDEGEG